MTEQAAVMASWRRWWLGQLDLQLRVEKQENRRQKETPGGREREDRTGGLVSELKARTEGYQSQKAGGTERVTEKGRQRDKETW